MILDLILALLISFILGIFYSFFFRKVYARLQARKGPFLIVPKEVRKTLGFSRILQPFYDFLKLYYKEVLIPKTANKKLFKLAPYIALGSIILSVLFIPILNLSFFGSYSFSLIIIIYLLLIPSLSIAIGGYSSSSPWGAIGAYREVELMLIYEFVQILVIFSLAIVTNSFSILDIIEFQKNRIPFIALNPFAAIAFLFVIVGKLRIKPFDIVDASVEVVAGPETEYSGRLFGILELGKIFLIFVYTTLFVDLFLIDGINFFPQILFIIKSLLLVFILALINAINPRYRIDQAFMWYIKYQVPLSIIAILWSYIIKFVLKGY